MKLFSEALLLEAYSVAEGQHLGKIIDFMFQLSDGKILGWLIKSGHIFTKQGGLPSSSLIRLGKDISLVDTLTSVEWDALKKKNTSELLWGSRFLSVSFWERGGREIGSVEDMVLSADGQWIKGFVLNNGALIPMEEHCRLGRDSAVLADLDRLFQSTGKKKDLWALIEQHLV